MSNIVQPLSPGLIFGSPFGIGTSFIDGEVPIIFSGTALRAAPPSGGSFFGFCFITQAPALSVGFCACRPSVNGVGIGPTVEIGVGDGLTVFRRLTTPVPFTAADELGVRVTTPASMTPSPLDIVFIPYMVFNRGVSTDEGGI